MVYNCSCGKSYSYRQSLYKHRKTCDKKYKCACGNIYSTRQSLHVHRKNCNGYNKLIQIEQLEEQPRIQVKEVKDNEQIQLIIEQNSDINEKYYCACGKSYIYKPGLYKHRKNCNEYNNPNQIKHEEPPRNKQLLEEQETRYKQLLEEKDKLLQEKDAQYALLQEQHKQLEQKYMTLLYDQLQYFVNKDKKMKDQNQRAYEKRLEKIKCKSDWCDTIGNAKYEGYCMPCFVNNPENNDKPVVRNYKTKEKDVADRIQQTFTNFTWVADKRVQDGCSRRRPDLLLDMGSHVIIVEVDENKHSNYDCSCENKRIMEISRDLQHRPIVFIRFNPDEYVDSNGNTVSSCWKLNKRGVMQIEKSKEKEWEERIDILKEQIRYWVNNATDKTVETIELFY